MRVTFDPDLLAQLARAEADARGLGRALEELAELRVADGFDAEEALGEAGRSLRIVAAFEERLASAATSLEAEEIDAVHCADARAGMPTLRRQGATVRFEHAAGTADALATSLGALVACLAADPERNVAQLAVGLGGSGGCAAGECLPEDAPPGPLFARSARVRP